MSLISRLLGLIPISIGLLLGYGLYLFVLNMYITFKWILTPNAPEASVIMFIILIIMTLLGVFALVIIVIFFFIWIGTLMLFDEN